MSLLKKVLPFICIFCLFTGCTKQIANSPAENIELLQKAYKTNDATLMYSLLSKESKNKISKLKYLLETMPLSQKESIAKTKDVPLKLLTSKEDKDLIFLYFKFIKNEGKDIINKTIISELLSVSLNKEKNQADCLFSNGVTMKFLKENDGWKIDITDL